MTTTSQRRISIERMAAIWRAVTNPINWDQTTVVTFGDLLDFDFEADTFEEFLTINADRVQLYEEAV